MSFTSLSVSLFSKSSLTSLIKDAMSFISSTPIPLVVRAGVPRRIPLVTKGLRVSPGTVFLFVVIPASSRAFSKTFPVSLGWVCVRSKRIRWLSVPPDTSLNPNLISSCARAFVLSMTACWYFLNLSESASLKPTALLARICPRGHP